MDQNTPMSDYLSGEILRDINEKLVIASVHQHELAEIATQANQRLSALVNGLDAVICEINVLSGDIIFISERAESFLGYERDRWNKRGFWRRVLHADDRAATLACLYESIRSQQDCECEFRATTAGGRTVWLRNRVAVSGGSNNAVILMRCVIVDVSASKQSDATIARSERRYRRLFEAAQDGILLLDVNTGVITDANPFMTELLGYSHDELVDKELWQIGLLQDKEASQSAFRRIEQQGYIRYENLPLENKRGERREIELVGNLYRENGHTVIQCNIRDITERKRVEAELAAAAIKNERIAETLQRSMLQSSPEGKFTGVAVETLYKAALDEANVGGDFFDAFALSGDRVALVVGDVSGKGLLAAGRTAEVKYALRAFLHEYSAPEIALTHLNRFIYETHLLDADNKESFIILALTVLDVATGNANFSAAGAEATLILRGNGAAEPVEVFGMPLGVHLDATYAVKTLSLAPGETVLMATDGITEARRGKEFLGAEGLAALVERAGPGASLLELSRTVYAGARDFADGNLRDDVCLLVARRD